MLLPSPARTRLPSVRHRWWQGGPPGRQCRFSSEREPGLPIATLLLWTISESASCVSDSSLASRRQCRSRQLAVEHYRSSSTASTVIRFPETPAMSRNHASPEAARTPASGLAPALRRASFFYRPGLALSGRRLSGTLTGRRSSMRSVHSTPRCSGICRRQRRRLV